MMDQLLLADKNHQYDVQSIQQENSEPSDELDNDVDPDDFDYDRLFDD